MSLLLNERGRYCSGVVLFVCGERTFGEVVCGRLSEGEKNVIVVVKGDRGGGGGRGRGRRDSGGSRGGAGRGGRKAETSLSFSCPARLPR